MASTTPFDGHGREAFVARRYSAAAKEQEPALCCPIVYRSDYLERLPQEILEKDHGCGDPTPYVREGDTVLDLGSGGGKVCYIASQVVGPEGRFIGVDCNRPKNRHPRETKGLDYDATTESNGVCTDGGGCC